MNPTMTRTASERTSKHVETTNTFKTWDSTELFYRAWLPSAGADRAVVLLHRGHEHSGRFSEMAAAIAQDGVAYFAWDQRGHGHSPGERGYAESFAALIKDVEWFVRHIQTKHAIPIENMVVVGHSVGAVLAAAWVHDYAPRIKAMVLGTPALRIKLYVPFAIPLLRLLQRIKRHSFIKSYVRAKMLTHDSAEAAKYDQDSLIARNIAVNILLDLHDTSTRLMKDAGAIRTPTLLLSAGSDWVVEDRAQEEFFKRLSSPVKHKIRYDAFHHAIFHEKDRRLPFDEVRKFIAQAFSGESSLTALIGADREGYTKSEFDRLSTAPNPLSPAAMGFAFSRLSMKTLGRLSKGIRIGWRTGFDSGESLDHVYANRAEGFTPLGRFLDRAFLDAIGWRGIRKRKANLEKLLDSQIARQRAERRPIRIVDIAAGPGRYLLDTLKRHTGEDISALLRDRSKSGLEAGRLLAREMGITNATYVEGDAFDPKSLAGISPRPNIAIVSGLYELFADNERILRSLRGLHSVLQEDGCLIYTNQPWHPQVEMIARTLINRDGKPWIMRRRTQEEMDGLVEAAGFEKMEMEIDEWGIFTVSVAKRV